MNKRGFTLMELAVVLAILALVLAAGITMGTNAMKTAERITTEERLNVIKRALDDYAALNNTLPCPANRAQTPGTHPQTFGTDENCVNQTGVRLLTYGGLGEPVWIGAVPVRSLGLPDNYAADGWGNKFNYIVSQNVIYNFREYDPVLSVRTHGGSTNPYLTSKTDRAYVPTGARQSITPGEGAAYGVMSYGPDSRGAYPLNGTNIATGCGASTVENCRENDFIIWDSPNREGAEPGIVPIDDIVVWGSNALHRPPLDPVVLKTPPGGCASGCEAWCAPCTTNLPPTTPDAPDGGMTTQVGGPFLCKKMVISTTPCQAACIWGGKITADSSMARCP